MANHIRLPLAAKAVEAQTPVIPASKPSLPAVEEADGFMQVGDLARESGKTVRAIHLYEELGLLRPTARSKGRFRLYGTEAILRIRWISKLQDIGFSLTEIQAVANEFDQTVDSGSAPAAMVRMRDLYRVKLAETRSQLQRLLALEHEIVASLDYLETCEVCDPARLITACQQCDQHVCGQEAPELVAGFRAKPS
jgi:MerR family copper efflux transcriptional regulator